MPYNLAILRKILENSKCLQKLNFKISKLTLSLRFCSAHLVQSIPIEIPELRGDWAVYFDFKLLANYRFVWIQINYTFWKHMTLYSVFGWKESKSESKGELCYTVMDIRLSTYGYLISQLPKWKWGHFERAKNTFKMLPASWFLICF